jgi:outer membrane protein TolC
VQNQAGIRRAGAGAALAGCKVGPDYHRPETPPVGEFREKSAGVSSDPLPERWWHLYDDPVLDRLEEQALAANTDLRAAEAHLQRAVAVTAAAESVNEPDFGIGAGMQRSRLSGQSYLQQETLPVMTLGSVLGQMSYQIDLFGRIRRGVEAARADEEGAHATLEAARTSLAAQVAYAYLAQCASAEALELAEANLDVQRRSLESSRKLLEAGKISVAEVTRAEARLAQAETAPPVARAHSRAALYQLAWLVGKTPENYPRDAEKCRAIPQLSRAAGGRRRRAAAPPPRCAPRRKAGGGRHRAVGIATAELYPQISIGASGGSIGLLSDLGDGKANTWGFGPLIRWTIPNGMSRAKVRAAKADTQAALASFDGTVLGALRETETALSNYAHDRDRLVALMQAREAAEQGIRETRQLRMAGKSQLLADLGEQSGALAAKTQELAGREAVALDQVTLFLALGGGW